MNVLGISGRTRDAAAALAVDGRIVAAVAEDCFARVPNIGYAQTGGFPYAAAQACLEAAGVAPGDVQQVTVVDDEGRAVRPPVASGRLRDVPMRTVGAVEADAIQAALTSGATRAVLVVGTAPPVIAAFVRNGDGLGPRIDIGAAGGAHSLARGASALAATLGLTAADPLAALDHLSLGAEPAFQAEVAAVVRWAGASGLAVDEAAFDGVVRRVSGAHAGSLADVTSLNVRVHETRRQLAASFMCQLADVVGHAAESVSAHAGAAAIAAGGALFANPRFNTELRRKTNGDLTVAAVPEAVGRAVGAAGVDSTRETGLANGLALGPSFSEEDIKRTLDNCRLDYVYEPDWARLLARVSRMLAQGKVVAWFQGAMAFGPRAMGTRSILCDPSNKYARQNLNEYLRRVPIDEPLAVAFAPSMSETCLVQPVAQPFGIVDAAIRPEWRSALASALDWRQHARVHGMSRSHAPRLCDLLELHHAATGTPGLIETNLCSPGEPVACTPRDAVRTVYSSATDALVIGRFLLMKDYWLLRSHEAR